jgi:hypothetical protein
MQNNFGTMEQWNIAGVRLTGSGAIPLWIGSNIDWKPEYIANMKLKTWK